VRLLLKKRVKVDGLGRVEVLREELALIFPFLVVRLNEKRPTPSYPKAHNVSKHVLAFVEAMYSQFARH
jgi:hypothetical protein